jgi:hypothetical protein
MMTTCGFGTIESNANQVTDKRIRLLFDAFLAPTDKGLQMAMNRSLDLFNRRLKGKELVPYEAIAIEETLITLLWKLKENVDLSEAIDADLQPHILKLVG